MDTYGADLPFSRETELLNDDMLTINWSVGFKRRRMLFSRPTGKNLLSFKVFLNGPLHKVNAVNCRPIAYKPWVCLRNGF